MRVINPIGPLICIPIIALSILIHDASSSGCIMDEKCGTTQGMVGPLPIPCDHPHEPALLNLSLIAEDKLHIFTQLCPHLDIHKPMCCTPLQVEGFAENINLAVSFLGKCPGCMRNFARFFCDLPCSPEQDSFLKVTKHSPSPDIPGQFQVDGLSMNVSKVFAKGMYDSCDSVSASGTPALSFMCGRDVKECTGQLWLEYLGSKPRSPFNIDFTWLDHDDRMPFHRCNETMPDWPPSNQSCTCADCDLCGAFPFDFNGNEIHLDMMLWAGISIGLFVLFILVILVIFVLEGRRRRRRLSIITVDDESPLLGPKPKNTLINLVLRTWTRFLIRHPNAVLVAVVCIMAALSTGIMLIKIEKDPVNLWSDAASKVRKEKDFYDKNFGPFYRVEQVVFTIEGTHQREIYVGGATPTENFTVGNVFHKEVLDKLYQFYIDSTELGLDKVCQKLRADKGCMVQSFLNFYQEDDKNLNYVNETTGADYMTHMLSCITSAYDTLDINYQDETCLGSYGGPGFTQVLFAGYNTTGGVPAILQSSSLMMTFLVNNGPEGSKNKIEGMKFEKKWLDFIADWIKDNGDITLKNGTKLSLRTTRFSERSIQDELDRQSEADVLPIAASYIAMFLYVTFSLGSFNRIHTRISLGLVGVIVVLFAVAAAVGTGCYLRFIFPNLEFNLIIIEVIPFLLLAVGVDNIFLMVQAFDRTYKKMIRERKGDGNAEERVEEVFLHVCTYEAGPSIFASSSSQSICFFLAAIMVDMPAVTVFAVTAGLSLFYLVIMQLSIFLVVFLYDMKRQLVHKQSDIIIRPFVYFMNSPDFDPDHIPEPYGIVDAFTKKVLVPLTSSSQYTRAFLLCLWALTLSFAIFAMPSIDVGLDQEESVPKDSYVASYFHDMKYRMRVGAPVYFVVDVGDLNSSKSLHVSDRLDQNLLGAFPEASLQSMANTLSFATKKDNITRVTGPFFSWVDQLDNWFMSDKCCKFQNKSTTTFCDDFKSAECVKCTDVIPHPSGDDFNDLLTRFLDDFPGVDCAFGGAAPYSQAIHRNSEGEVTSFYMFAYHLAAPSSHDLVESLSKARFISDQLQYELHQANKTDTKVYPYSLFYVYYEQYLTMWASTGTTLGTAMVSVLICIILSRVLWNFVSHYIIFVVTLSSIIAHLMGLMYICSISLNPISMVNLTMSIGISVEFTSHLLIAFTRLRRSGTMEDSTQMVAEMMSKTGSSVLSGITLTKLIGVCVLGLTNSKIFSIYYFRFYLLLVASGALHALFYLPSLLSYLPASSTQKNQVTSVQ